MVRHWARAPLGIHRYQLAAFMLHQAMEQALCGLLLAGTGYYCNIHNVEKMLRFASLVCYQLPDVFDSTRAAHQQQLHCLQKAYIGARYDPEFVVSSNSIQKLMEKVARVLSLCEQTANNYLSHSAK